MRKTAQLQIRLSPREKDRIVSKALGSNMDVSKWVLNKLIPSNALVFDELVESISKASTTKSFAFNELGRFLSRLTKSDFQEALSEPPRIPKDSYHANYLAAMVELASNRISLPTPSWVSKIKPLDIPVFGSDLESLRLHLLSNSLPPFRNRNIFVDSSIGDFV